MIRLNRAGREAAIKDAIRKLKAQHKTGGFTKGEICRKMGIKSTSRIRDILREMVERGDLVGGTTALDNYAHEVEVFYLPRYEQMSISDDHVIVINGVSCRMNGEVIAYA